MTQRRDELARRRARAGFTQESLAEHLQVARATIARWERGEGGMPYPRHRPPLAAALGISADETAHRLGTDGNYQWTAFGPTNVLAHRVAAEYALGNAGRAVQYYRHMDLTRLGTADMAERIGLAYVA